MIVPVVLPGMKQFDQLACLLVDRRNVWSLMKIAVWASEAKIRKPVIFDVLPRMDVLNVKC